VAIDDLPRHLIELKIQFSMPHIPITASNQSFVQQQIQQREAQTTASGSSPKNQMGVSNSKSKQSANNSVSNSTVNSNVNIHSSKQIIQIQQANSTAIGNSAANNQSNSQSPNNNNPHPRNTSNNTLTTTTTMPPPHVKPGLLPPLSPAEQAKGRKTLVLDLDETLVHSSFKPIPNADFVISIELEGVIHRVYVRKRPGVDAFLKTVAQKWEVVIFTASLSKYADPLLDILDKSKAISSRLFREHCVQHHGNYVKDMTQLGRRVEHVVIVDNSPFSYMFQPENAIAITSWFNDKSDRQLYELMPFLDSLVTSDDVIETMAQKAMTFSSGHPTHGPTPGTSIPPSKAPGLTTGLIAQYTNPDDDD